MQPANSYEDLMAMVEMHDDVQEKIRAAFDSENYIECCWFCYACFESRVNRTMEKLCPGCAKPDRTTERRVGITTKLHCLNKLNQSGYELFEGADLTVVTNVISWCKERNKLIHGLVSLNQYEKSNYRFRNLAKRGVPLVERFYASVTKIRTNYYNADALPPLDESVVGNCRLKSKCMKGAFNEAAHM